MTMITPSYLGETIEYSSLHACRSTLEDPTEFDALENRLAQNPYLLGRNLSVLDIAWFIYAHRLSLAGYPFARLHPRVDAFVQRLRARPEFASEIANSPEFDARLEATHKAQLQAGKTLEMVAGF